MDTKSINTSNLLLVEENMLKDKILEINSKDIKCKKYLIQEGKAENGVIMKIKDDCNIKYKIQRYLYNTEKKEIITINKDYNNTKTFKMKGKKDDLYPIIKSCLLCMNTVQKAIIILSNTNYQTLYNSQIKEAGIQDIDKLDGNIYIYIDIKVVIATVSIPNDFEKLYPFTKQVSSYIRYYIAKEEYKEAISLANQARTNVIKMSKAIRQKFEKSKTIKIKIMDEMMNIILNSLKAYKCKSGISKINYNDALKAIPDYVDYIKMRGKFDDKELKFWTYNCLFNILLDKFDEAKNIINIINTTFINYTNKDLLNQQINYLQFELNKKSNNKKNKEKKTINMMSCGNNKTLRAMVMDYNWGSAMNYDELQEYMDTANNQMDQSIKMIFS